MSTQRPIAMRPVSSSNLTSLGHDPATRTLQVAFKGGDVYSYAGVPATTYQAMVDAESVGQFFNKNIKAKYQGTRLTPPKPKKNKPQSQ
jgi:hypothetical protein